MNKSELIDSVAQKSGLTKEQATKAVNAFVSSVEDVMTAGDSLTLVSFGTFGIKERAARTGRNPQTGAEIQIAASKVASFKAGKTLKDRANGVKADAKPAAKKETASKDTAKKAPAKKK